MNDENEFSDVVRAMNTLKFSEETQMDLFTSIAAILHLGNVKFIEGKW